MVGSTLATMTLNGITNNVVVFVAEEESGEDNFDAPREDESDDASDASDDDDDDDEEEEQQVQQKKPRRRSTSPSSGSKVAPRKQAEKQQTSSKTSRNNKPKKKKRRTEEEDLEPRKALANRSHVKNRHKKRLENHPTVGRSPGNGNAFSGTSQFLVFCLPICACLTSISISSPTNPQPNEPKAQPNDENANDDRKKLSAQIAGLKERLKVKSRTKSNPKKGTMTAMIKEAIKVT